MGPGFVTRNPQTKIGNRLVRDRSGRGAVFPSVLFGSVLKYTPPPFFWSRSAILFGSVLIHKNNTRPLDARRSPRSPPCSKRQTDPLALHPKPFSIDSRRSRACSNLLEAPPRSRFFDSRGFRNFSSLHDALLQTPPTRRNMHARCAPQRVAVHCTGSRWPHPRRARPGRRVPRRIRTAPASRPTNSRRRTRSGDRARAGSPPDRCTGSSDRRPTPART